MADINNLCRWAMFFKRLLEPTGPASARFLTFKGESRTSIAAKPQDAGVYVTITSDFSGQVEHADVRLRSDGTGTEVTFLLTMPPDASAETAAAMNAAVERDLSKLKQILEGTNA